MTALIIFGAAFAGLYGIVTLLSGKTPLFYKISVYAFCCNLLSVFYSILHRLLLPDMGGFHVGFFGHAGTFFFLFSSYFGALDRLADGGEKQYRKYRFTALLPSAFILACSFANILLKNGIWRQLLLLPVAATAYYCCKHLILPDVEMGIIKVMRPYNAVILLICLIQPFVLSSAVSVPAPLINAVNAVLTVAALPLAYRGCRKWFI